MKKSGVDWRQHIALDPGILRGKPTIKGTRVAVQVVVGSLAGGMGVEEVCEQYRLTSEQVHAALAYAAEIVGEERVYALAR